MFDVFFSLGYRTVCFTCSAFFCHIESNAVGCSDSPLVYSFFFYILLCSQINHVSDGEKPLQKMFGLDPGT